MDGPSDRGAASSELSLDPVRQLQRVLSHGHRDVSGCAEVAAKDAAISND
jgi:hypothetical protein